MTTFRKICHFYVLLSDISKKKIAPKNGAKNFFLCFGKLKKKFMIYLVSPPSGLPIFYGESQSNLNCTFVFRRISEALI